MTCEPLSGRPRRLDTPTTRDPRHALAWSCSQCLSSERPVPPPFRPTRDDGRAGRPHCIRPGTATSIAVRTDITMSACPRIVPCRTGDRSPGWHLITPPLTAEERARPPAVRACVRALTTSPSGPRRHVTRPAADDQPDGLRAHSDRSHPPVRPRYSSGRPSVCRGAAGSGTVLAYGR